MQNDDNQEQQCAVRDRIANLIRANEGARKKQITAEEVQKLKAAASRLDQMLKASAEADAEALKSAAARLDRMLSDLCQGKDFSGGLKLRPWTGKR